MHVAKVTNPGSPQYLGTKLDRCQRVGIGPVLADGTRVVYFAHHGDTWVPTPLLATYHVTPATELVQQDIIQETDTLFEGMTWRDNILYVAVHGGGLRIYPTPGSGVPTVYETLGGFENAWKIALLGDHGYVADGEGGLKVIDVSEPAAPTMVGAIPTPALARDVDADGQRVFVAFGGGGIGIYDVSAPAAPSLITLLDGMGSVQAVSADDGLLAVAAWSHLALYDTATLQLLGTEQIKLFPQLNQVFGVALHNGIAHVAEWEGMHFVQYAPGQVGPDLWITDELINFGKSKTKTQGVLVRNRGLLPLSVSSITALPANAYAVDPTSLEVEPGGVALLEVSAVPDGPVVDGNLSLSTNDPDSGQSPFEMHLINGGGDFNTLAVGDSITDAFGFLDPSGAGQVSALSGHVVVLAYFALF